MRTLVILAISYTTAYAVNDIYYGWKPDPYYTYVSFSRSFRKEKLVRVNTSETALYKSLLKKSLSPTTVLFEFFASPLPYAAAYTKTNHPGLYGDFGLPGSANVLNALTAGEEDPWGASVFLGKIVPFRPAGRSRGFTGIAYSGGLFTYGNKHLKNNRIYDDPWYQFEWKIKGLRINPLYKQDWSFRAGMKLHGNENIADVFYISLFRDRIDYFIHRFSFWRNSGFDVYAAFRRKDLNPVKLSILLGRNFPSRFKKRRVTYSLSLGMLWEGTNKYSGYLRETNQNPRLQFILRPTVKF